MDRKPSNPATVEIIPPPTERELTLERQTTALLHGLADELLARNLENAVLLAQQAARRSTELTPYFAEIGRRFGHLLNAAPPKPKFRTVKGGKAPV